MSDELVMAVMPSEMFSVEQLVVWDPKKNRHVRVRDLYTRDEWWQQRRDYAKLEAAHPGLHWLLPIRPLDRWTLPREPYGLRARGASAGRLTHRRATRASLEMFLNDRLAELDGMVRTGFWILAEARVRVSKFTDVPAKPQRRKLGPTPVASPNVPVTEELRRRQDLASEPARRWPPKGKKANKKLRAAMQALREENQDRYLGVRLEDLLARQASLAPTVRARQQRAIDGMIKTLLAANTDAAADVVRRLGLRKKPARRGNRSPTARAKDGT